MVDAVAEGQVVDRVLPLGVERARVGELPGVAVGGTGQEQHRAAGRDVDAADGRADLGHAELGPERALVAQRLLDEVRDEVAVGPQAVLEVRPLGEDPQRERQQADRGLLAAREEVGGEQRDVVHLGHRPVGEGGRGHLRQDVVAGLPPAVLDVGGELLVEELERLVLHALGHLAEPLGERRRGPPRARLRARRRPAARTASRSRRPRRSGPCAISCSSRRPEQAGHELLVLAEPARGEEAHHRAPGGRCGPAGRTTAAGR